MSAAPDHLPILAQYVAENNDELATAIARILDERDELLVRLDASLEAKTRPFCLSFDSGSREEPPNRWFGSLQAALLALTEVPEWKQWAWITEKRSNEPAVIHMRDGKLLVKP